MKLDFGCGKRKCGPDWTGVDAIKFEGVDEVVDLTARDHVDACSRPAECTCPFKPWPWADESVDEAHASHFVEHLYPTERIHFANELFRILKPRAQARIIVPHWANERAYGDLTHRWPPVTGFWFYYLSVKWRNDQAPHSVEYECNFEATWGAGIPPELASRSDEYKVFATAHFVNTCVDLVATMTKIPLDP